MELSESIKRHTKRTSKRKKAAEISKTILASLVIFVLSNIFEMTVKKNNIYDSTSFFKFLVNYNKNLLAFCVFYLAFTMLSFLIFKVLKKDKIFNEFFPSSIKKIFSCFVVFSTIVIIISKIFVRI